MKIVPILTLVILSSTSFAQDTALKAQFQATYDKVDALKTKKDIAGLRSYLAETRTKDWVFFAKSRKLTLKDVNAGIGEAMSIIDKVTEATVKIEKMIVKDSKATVTLSTVFAFVTKPMQDKHTHVLSEHVLSEDTWIKTDTGWKIQTSNSISEHFLRDGKSAPIR
jgi:hypothetical protein